MVWMCARRESHNIRTTTAFVRAVGAPQRQESPNPQQLRPVRRQQLRPVCSSAGRLQSAGTGSGSSAGPVCSFFNDQHQQTHTHKQDNYNNVRHGQHVTISVQRTKKTEQLFVLHNRTRRKRTQSARIKNNTQLNRVSISSPTKSFQE